MNRLILTLVATRLGRYYKHQYRIWKSTLDWTVALYIIIPGLLFAIGTYRSWWQQPPDWLLGMPEPLAAMLMLVFVWLGSLRTFVQEADVLILRQRPAMMKELAAYGIVYTTIMRTMSTAVLFGALSIWFVRTIGLSAQHLIWWLLFTVACGTSFAIIKHLVGARWNGWRRYTAIAASTAISTVYLQPVFRMLDDPKHIAALKLGTLLAWLTLAAVCIIRLRVQGTFASDVRAERKAMMAGVDFLLSQSVERKPTILLRTPLLFRRSGRLYRRDDPASLLAEMRIKSFIRRLANVQLMLSFLFLSSAAVLMTPVWLSIPLALVLPGIAASWLHQQWKTWIAEPFVAQFQWDTLDASSASRTSTLWLLAPGFLWLLALSIWHALQ